MPKPRSKADAPPPGSPPDLPRNAFARVLGRDAPLHALLPAAAGALADAGLVLRHAAADPLDDYAAIDPALTRAPLPAVAVAAPASGLGYAGFDPVARSQFLAWLDTPQHQAPHAFQMLYLAHLETVLVEAAARAQPTLAARVVATLRELEVWPHWQTNLQRAWTLLLACTVQGDGAQIGAWLAESNPPAAVLGVALGRQALLGAPLTPAQALNLARLWGITEPSSGPGLDAGIVTLRLRSLCASLDADPLAYALRAVQPAQPAQPDPPGSAANAAAPWPLLPYRTAHRDLRLACAQPDLAPLLAPLLAEMLDDVPPAAAAAPAADKADAEAGWQLVLEFGHSRSEYFEFALQHAQRLPGYSALLDEKRTLVHRVHFKKSELRRFWQLWEYVMNWTDTHVYVNGKELAKWQIWPYSQYLT